MWASHAQVTATGLHISKQCFLLFFLYDHYCYYYHFYKTPLRLVSVFISSISISAQQSFLFPFLRESALMRFVWFSCVGFLWAVLDILHGLVFFFLCYLYICLFPALIIALMVLSTVLPPYSLMLFSMANWAPQSTVFISRSTHPASSSFLSPSVLLASGVNCTVKLSKLHMGKWKWNQYMSQKLSKWVILSAF